jgi:hypothetical protein
VSARTVRALKELTRWYIWHKKSITDPDKRAEFLEDVFTNHLNLLASVVEDVQKLEQDKKELILPTGVKLHANLRARGQ